MFKSHSSAAITPDKQESDPLPRANSDPSTREISPAATSTTSTSGSSLFQSSARRPFGDKGRWFFSSGPREAPREAVVSAQTQSQSSQDDDDEDQSTDEKFGFLEKCKVHMLTRTRKAGITYFFRLSRTYLQFYDTPTSTTPKRAEVRLKIVRVTSTKGSGFDIHFRNGSVWHLAAGNLVEKIEWMEAISPGSFPSKSIAIASSICCDGIDNPASELPSPTSDTVTPTSGNATPTAGSPGTTTADGGGGDTPVVEIRRECPPAAPSDASFDSDSELLDSILDEVDAMDLALSAAAGEAAKLPAPKAAASPKAPASPRAATPKTRVSRTSGTGTAQPPALPPSPTLPKRNGGRRAVRSPAVALALADYVLPLDSPISDYMDADYEDHDMAGMAGASTVEIKHYAVPLFKTMSTASSMTVSLPSPGDSLKFLTVAMEKKDVLHQQLRSSSKVIMPSEITIKQQIGKGAFGAVHLAEWTFRADCPSVDVAVKSLQESSDEKAEKDFLAEARIMAEFDHTNIVRLFGVIDDGSSSRIVTEYMSNGSLKDFLVEVRTKDPHLRPLSQLLQYLVDIAAGLKYLGDEGFIHRDLAARNVLVSEDERCKITDFGLSRKLDEDEDEYMSSGGLLPLKWTSPEAGMEKCFTTASDVWSLGVTMWEVMTYGKKPYASLSFLTLFPQLQRGVRLGQPRDCPSDLYDLMKRCWEWEREDRPTCASICEQLQEISKREQHDSDDEDASS